MFKLPLPIRNLGRASCARLLSPSSCFSAFTLLFSASYNYHIPFPLPLRRTVRIKLDCSVTFLSCVYLPFQAGQIGSLRARKVCSSQRQKAASYSRIAFTTAVRSLLQAIPYINTLSAGTDGKPTVAVRAAATLRPSSTPAEWTLAIAAATAAKVCHAMAECDERASMAPAGCTLGTDGRARWRHASV